jgi:hypothetical protein
MSENVQVGCEQSRSHESSERNRRLSVPTDHTSADAAGRALFLTSVRVFWIIGQVNGRPAASVFASPPCSNATPHTASRFGRSPSQSQYFQVFHGGLHQEIAELRGVGWRSKDLTPWRPNPAPKCTSTWLTIAAALSALRFIAVAGLTFAAVFFFLFFGLTVTSNG